MITQITKELIPQAMKTVTDELTEQIIGCCFQVHRVLGPGFPEKVYRSALVASLCAARLSVEEERRFTVRFEGVQVGDFRVDLLIGDRVILEVKAVIGSMPNVFGAQVFKRMVLSSAKSGRNLCNPKIGFSGVTS